MNDQLSQATPADETGGQGVESVWSELGKMLAERIDDLARVYDT